MSSCIIYRMNLIDFSSVGLFRSLLFYLRATWPRFERRMRGAIDRTRRCDGRTVDAIKQSSMCVLNHLSELIWTAHQESYNGLDHSWLVNPRFNHDRSIKIQRTRSKPHILFFMQWNRILTLRSRSDDHKIKTMIRSNGAGLRPLIAMKLHPTADIKNHFL